MHVYALIIYAVILYVSDITEITDIIALMLSSSTMHHIERWKQCNSTHKQHWRICMKVKTPQMRGLLVCLPVRQKDTDIYFPSLDN